MTAISFMNSVFVISMIILAISIIAIFLRAVIGPTVADRIICINMIGTKIIIFICILAGFLGEEYLIDVAIVYALINFISIVVLTYSYGYAFQKKEVLKKKSNMKIKSKKGGRR